MIDALSNQEWTSFKQALSMVHFHTVLSGEGAAQLRDGVLGGTGDGHVVPADGAPPHLGDGAGVGGGRASHHSVDKVQPDATNV